MGISVEAAAKELQGREKLYVAYSLATKLPYVVCDEESFNDQALVFSTEEGLKEFGKKKLEEKIPLQGRIVEKKDYPRFYGVLYAIGVDCVMWVDGEERVEVELEKIARKADFSKLEPQKRPLMNPTLQMSGIYFMQELRRPVTKEERQSMIGRMRELEEEFLANLRKAEYLLAMDVNKDKPGQFQVPYMKTKNGDVLQPIFTDAMEFTNFTKGKKIGVAKVTLDKLPGLLIKEAKAYVINPMGINLIVDRNLLAKLTGNVQPASAQPGGTQANVEPAKVQPEKKQ